MVEHSKFAHSRQDCPVRLSRITSRDGCTKTYNLDKDGNLLKGSAPNIVEATVDTLVVSSPAELATVLLGLKPSQGLLAGTPPDGEQGRRLTTRDNARTAPNALTRTKDVFTYRPGEPVLLCLDVDYAAFPLETQKAIKAIGGVRKVLARICPPLDEASAVWRASPSSGVIAPDGTETGFRGCHGWIWIADGNE